MNNQLFVAQQFHAAMKLFIQNVELSDSEKMQIADLYPAWETDKYLQEGQIVKHGVNLWDETQLWIVNKGQSHKSQVGWEPDVAVSLFSKIGFTEEGVPIWTQPLTYDDAYDIGDEVEHPEKSGDIWVCEQGNANGDFGPRNTFEPGIWGWKKK